MCDVTTTGISLVFASADSDTATANIGTGTVTWNGAIPVGGDVAITIHATKDDDIADGALIVNQGTVHFDADGNGSNEATATTDDPSTAAANDGTTLVIEGGSVEIPTPAPAVIPATSDRIALLLATMLAPPAVFVLRGTRRG